ncbi:hypothetical protein BGT96224_Ac31410 [Blumeria graminis f. sp. tritici 96224]|uniref:Uncharacterized protein n=1 Tax=Blumeria graminis f. sp. tritici 96224 TaxID=1268274 RepID=A0A656KK17_BLUGR|nr:hypothetical protein BGT96224_Ac31410 [Blumeria graminis f. sp. tritici 96224]
MFLINKDRSDQNPRIWECYQSYETNEIENREKYSSGTQLKAQTTNLFIESDPRETLKLTHKQKNPRIFTDLETSGGV